MPEVAAYLRVSSSLQGEKWSLSAQREAINRFCASRGWDEPAWYVETRSAKDDDPERRPVFRQLLADARDRRFGVLVVVNANRFARSIIAGYEAAARFERAGVRVVTVDEGDIELEDPEGEFSFGLRLLLARRENRVLGRRVRSGLDAARAAGRWVRRIPYGAVLGPDGRLALDPETAPILGRILREATGETFNQIAGRLTADGVPPPGARMRGTRWGAVRPFWWPNSVQLIVEHSDWLDAFPEPWPTLRRAAQARRRRPHVRGGYRTHMLTGLARCACGGILRHSLGRHRIVYFNCLNPARGGTGSGCPVRHGPVAFYEGRVRDAIAALPPPAEIGELLRDEDPAAWEALAEERRLLDFRLKHGFVGPDQALAELADIQRRETALPRGGAELARLRLDLGSTLEYFDTLEPPDRNTTLRLLIEEIVVGDHDLRIAWRPEARRLFRLPDAV